MFIYRVVRQMPWAKTEDNNLRFMSRSQRQQLSWIDSSEGPTLTSKVSHDLVRSINGNFYLPLSSFNVLFPPFFFLSFLYSSQARYQVLFWGKSQTLVSPCSHGAKKLQKTTGVWKSLTLLHRGEMVYLFVQSYTTLDQT